MSDLLRLLDDYVAVAGGTVETPEEGLRLFRPAPTEEHWFGAPERLLALDPESMDLHPRAEIAVLGSRFAEDLITAIRSRGSHVNRGFLTQGPLPEPRALSDEMVVRRGRVLRMGVGARWLPLGRLRVAASVRAGHQVEDHLVETGVFDLTTGRPVPQPHAVGARDPSLEPEPEDHEVAGARPLNELLPAMLDDIEDRLSEAVQVASDEAERTLTRELARLQQYYDGLVQEARDRGGKGSQDAIRAYRADHERRRAEQLARNQASAELRPVQIEVFYALAQQAEVVLETEGSRGTVTGRRLLLGSGTWEMPCPACQVAEPQSWAVCTAGHVTCSDCTDTCSDCGATTCERHGGGRCAPSGEDGSHSLCSHHTLTCSACDDVHCVEHSALCRAENHMVCMGCIARCASCGTSVCATHSTRPTAPAFIPGQDPRAEEGQNLCPACVRHCRGLKGEVRSRDEVLSCDTCGKDVCEEHRGLCSVGQTVHCASHLERTDRSRRLVCPKHQDRCSSEPDLLIASDEIEPCTACGTRVCDQHRHACYADGRLYCEGHIVELGGGDFSCAEHHGVCSVDSRRWKSAELNACSVCARDACSSHRTECRSCGCLVCSTDYSEGKKECRTCWSLKDVAQPDDRLLDAFATLMDEGLGRATQWEVARDATRRVVRMTLGRWGRHVTFSVPHGTSRVASAIRHGILLTKRLR